MEAGLAHLKNTVNAISVLSEPDWDRFKEIWMPFAATRKIVLTDKGETEKYLYFVLSGVQRIYYSDDKGREATIAFTYSPSFGGVLDAFMEQKPSVYFYETLNVSTFLRAKYSDLLPLMEHSPGVGSMIRKGLTGVIGGLLERQVELQCFSSEDKFRSLLSRSPHILQLVPHKYLASYLGIDPTNFSKFINSIVI